MTCSPCNQMNVRMVYLLISFRLEVWPVMFRKQLSNLFFGHRRNTFPTKYIEHSLNPTYIFPVNKTIS